MTILICACSGTLGVKLSGYVAPSELNSAQAILNYVNSIADAAIEQSKASKLQMDVAIKAAVEQASTRALASEKQRLQKVVSDFKARLNDTHNDTQNKLTQTAKSVLTTHAAALLLSDSVLQAFRSAAFGPLEKWSADFHDHNALIDQLQTIATADEFAKLKQMASVDDHAVQSNELLFNAGNQEFVVRLNDLATSFASKMAAADLQSSQEVTRVN
jgi:hypothetical protein